MSQYSPRGLEACPNSELNRLRPAVFISGAES